MSYVNARDVLPDEILKMIQVYLDGKYIYIPKKEENKKAWGELTQYKEEISIRNTKIYQDYLLGICIQSLSERYYLSPKSIQRIILQKREK